MNNRITEILHIDYPLVQGPMSWMTDAKLVAAVSNAGGLGILGPHAGQMKAAKTTEDLIAHTRAEIRKTRDLTGKPFGVSTLHIHDLSEIAPMVDLLIEEHVPVAMVNGMDGIDCAPTIAKLKAAGIKTLYRPLTSTVTNARYAEQSGADVFVVSGFDEGGTLPGQVIGTFSLVPQIADAVNIPVLASGGIADVRGVRAAFALGAEGIYAGTVFLATTECRMAESVKQRLVASTAQDLLLFRTRPDYYRSLPTALAKELVAMDAAGASREQLAEAQKGGYGMLEEGRADEGYISFGNGITYIHAIHPVKEVVADLMQDFKR